MSSVAESSIGRAGAVIASGTLVSRILGVVRMAVLAYAIGSTGLAANAFATASKIPGTIYVLIATGALTAVLVPQITKAALGDDAGQGYINKLVTLAIVGSAALVPVAAIITPLAIDALGAAWNNPQQVRLATVMAWWMLPQIVFYTLYTVVGEVLNARKVFGPYAWTPAINNIVSIAGLIVFVVMFGSDSDGNMSLARWSGLAVALVAGSSTLGVLVQGMALFLFWRRAGLTFSFDFRFRGVGLGKMGKIAFWTFMTVIVTQAVTLFQAAVLNMATQANEAGLAAFELVSLIFVLPHAIITISLVTANFTRMSESVNSGDIEQMKTYLSSAARLSAFAMMFFTTAIIVLAVPITSIILRASYDRIQIIAFLLILNMICLVPYSLNFVLNRGFFSLSDTKTPFFIVVGVSLLMVGSATFAATLPTAFIAATISLLGSIIVGLQTVVTYWLLRRRVGSLGGKQLTITLVQSLIAGLVSLLAGGAVLQLLGGIGENSFTTRGIFEASLVSALVSTVMALTYYLAALMLRNREAKVLQFKLKQLITRSA